MLAGKTVLVTGGAGSLGKAIVREIFSSYSDVAKVVVFSRDELKQHDLSWDFHPGRYPIKYVIGDIRDFEKVRQTFENVDIAIHAAAMKQISTCEENPEECYKTNVIGTQNVLKAAMHQKVSKLLFVSTDKAVDPSSAYGNSKQAAEKLLASSNDSSLMCSVIRLGNLIGSTGSVIPLFQRLKETGEIPVTNYEMTRFGGTMKEGAEACLTVLSKMKGGDIFAPKWRSFTVGDIAHTVAPEAKHRLIGLRKHEKMHEAFFSATEFPRLIETDQYFILSQEKLNSDSALDQYGGLICKNETSFRSDCCNHFSRAELRSMLGDLGSITPALRF